MFLGTGGAKESPLSVLFTLSFLPMSEAFKVLICVKESKPQELINLKCLLCGYVA